MVHPWALLWGRRWVGCACRLVGIPTDGWMYVCMGILQETQASTASTRHMGGPVNARPVRGLCKSGTHQTHHRTSLHNAQLCKQSQAALETREAAAFVRGCATRAAPQLQVWQRRRQQAAEMHKAAKQRTVHDLT